MWLWVHLRGALFAIAVAVVVASWVFQPRFSGTVDPCVSPPPPTDREAAESVCEVSLGDEPRCMSFTVVDALVDDVADNLFRQIEELGDCRPGWLYAEEFITFHAEQVDIFDVAQFLHTF